MGAFGRMAEQRAARTPPLTLEMSGLSERPSGRTRPVSPSVIERSRSGWTQCLATRRPRNRVSRTGRGPLKSG